LDTTRANIEFSVVEELFYYVRKENIRPFRLHLKGIWMWALKNFIAKKGATNIPPCVITVANNPGGG